MKLALFVTRLKHFWVIITFHIKFVEVNPIRKKEIKWSDYKKVPFLKIDGEQMVDSSDIIDKLFHGINPDSYIPDAYEERNGVSGWIITWCMFYHQTYIKQLLRHLNHLTISPLMAISVSLRG